MIEVREFTECEKAMKFDDVYTWWNTKGQDFKPSEGAMVDEGYLFQMVLAYHLHTRGVEAEVVKEGIETTPGIIRGPSAV